MPVSPLIGSFFGLNASDVPKDLFLPWAQSVEANINAMREPLTAPRTYFVRTGGNDSNSGLLNTDVGAFRTIQRAIDVAASLDVRGFPVTVQIADGTYAQSLFCRPMTGVFGDFGLILRGNIGNPAAVQIQAAPGLAAISGFYLGNSVVQVEGVHLSSVSGSGVFTDGAGDLRLRNVIMAGCAGYHLAAFNNSQIRLSGTLFIQGSAGTHLGAIGGSIEMTGFDVLFQTNIAFAFTAVAESLGRIRQTVGGQFVAGGFAVTGQRYLASTNAIINSGARGANHWPGSSAGGVNTGGQYL
jgi:hypothetical protein